MALNIQDFKVDPYRIDIPFSRMSYGGEKAEQMYKFFDSLRPGQSFTLPKKDIGWTRKLFNKWNKITGASFSGKSYTLIGRTTADPKIYRFWFAEGKKDSK